MTPRAEVLTPGPAQNGYIVLMCIMFFNFCTSERKAECIPVVMLAMKPSTKSLNLMTLRPKVLTQGGGIQNDHLVLMCMLEKSLLLLTYKLTTYLERL